MRIQHNIMAMNAYRNYNTNTSALSKNLEKLSSGYKINRAGDDAAGLAISEKMRAQITGLSAAQKNVKDGVSLVKTAEGAMQEIQDMLNRMDYLATQSANGTYDDPVDRLNLQKEVNQLRSEINRIADSANFNGINLLDGSLEDGAAAGGNPIDLNLTGVCARTDAVTQQAKTKFEVSLDGFSGTVADTATSSANITLNIGGVDVAVTLTFTANQTIDFGTATVSAASVVTINGTEFNVNTSTAGKLVFEAKEYPKTQQETQGDFNVTMNFGAIKKSDGSKINTQTQEVTPGLVKTTGEPATAQFELTKDIVNGGSVTIAGVSFTFDKETAYTGAVTPNATSIAVKDLLNADGELDTASLDEVANRLASYANANDTVKGHWTIGVSGNNITAQSKTSEKNDAYDLSTEDLVKAEFSATSGAMSGKALILQIGDTSDSFNQLRVSVGDMHVAAMGTDRMKIADIDISSQEGAKEAIDVIKSAINYVSGVRGDLGATQNRLEHTQKNLSVMAENITDAESTIRDTDIAEEMMSYTKNNILIQSAQAMLAQANAVPQGVLQLLG